MAENNVIDPVWVLSEETGKLTYDLLRHVSSNPKQELWIEHKDTTVSREFSERFKRIAEGQRMRGIKVSYGRR